MSEADFLRAISMIEHPSINATLEDLGILSQYKIVDKTLITEFSFPFPNVPIKDSIIASVEILAMSFGYQFEVSDRVMNEAEKQRFLEIEHANWKDGSSPMC
ncbi:MAG: hypothetical protein JXR60_06470 [Bacteroidales bacterium]|nr:hypothetical protein [Bacteroidales bacterium]